MSTRFDLDMLNRDPQLIALAALADDVFSFLNRQVTIPASCVGLVYADSSQPKLVDAGRPVESGNVRELLIARTVPFHLEYFFNNLASQDGYQFSASVKLSVRLVPDRTELEAFRRNILGSHRRVGQDRLLKHCEQPVRAAVASFAKSQTAQKLLSPECWNDFDGVLSEHFKPVGFESGLALGPDPDVVFESPAFEEFEEEQKVAALQRERQEREQQLREAASKAREQHLAEMGDLLEKVKTMADEGGALNVPELIKTFNASQRGQLYHGLMLTQEPVERTKAILVVAGGELLWFDPADAQSPTRRLKLPAGAGALRSVRLASNGESSRILVGARHGVHMIEEDGETVRTYSLSHEPEIRGGVNAAAILNDRLYATHSEVGLMSWALDSPGKRTPCLTEFTEGSRSVRDIQSEGNRRLWFSVDDLVVGWTPGDDASQTAMQAPAEVTALLLADGYAIAGLRNGSIVRWLTNNTSDMETVRSTASAPVRSLAWLSGGGVPRLLIGDGRQYLELLVLGDSYQGAYRCFHNLRWGFAAEDLIVGVNDRRDQLFIWHGDDPESPQSIVSIGRLIGRSIQDVALRTLPPASVSAEPNQGSATA